MICCLKRKLCCISCILAFFFYSQTYGNENKEEFVFIEMKKNQEYPIGEVTICYKTYKSQKLYVRKTITTLLKIKSNEGEDCRFKFILNIIFEHNTGIIVKKNYSRWSFGILDKKFEIEKISNSYLYIDELTKNKKLLVAKNEIKEDIFFIFGLLWKTANIGQKIKFYSLDTTELNFIKKTIVYKGEKFLSISNKKIKVKHFSISNKKSISEIFYDIENKILVKELSYEISKQNESYENKGNKWILKNKRYLKGEGKKFSANRPMKPTK